MNLPQIKPINFTNELNDNQSETPVTSEPHPLPHSLIINKAVVPWAMEQQKKGAGQWDIKELENFFKNTTLPSPPVKLNPWTTIIDIPLFITSHLEVIKVNNGVKNYEPYYNRLTELMNYLLSQLN